VNHTHNLAYLCGAIAGMLSRPLGWIITTPAGWNATTALCQRGDR
jgi:hypothetical protein